MAKDEIDTLSELVKRNAANLSGEVPGGERERTYGQRSSEKQVAEWIEAAKSLPKKVSY